ncbi:MAG: methionine--tRNA ligase [Symbiobacteriaceae bacterium]
MPEHDEGRQRRRKFYITTPIYYPNDRLHIGHTYTTVAADALARYHRLRGDETWLLTGTDEHGQKIERAARKAGKEPLEFIEPIVAATRELWQRLHISYDDFIRTTEDRHKKRVQEIFQRLYDQGDIYKGVYEGLYCTSCEAYYTESELLEGQRCPVHEAPVERLQEESYFFRLSKYAQPLLDHIERHPEFIQPPSRRNEVVAFIRQGLQDLSVSRTSFRWGIPVPFDPDHVIYVWIDALANYITALGWPDGELYRRFWPADVHLIGKDILRFHAIIWPALLMALGIPLPRCVYGHGWLLIDGGKIGKSRAGGQVIDPVTLIEKYGVDAVRYFLLREVPFGDDGTYTEEALVRRLNTDLANDLGNLVWRTTGMIERFLGGTIPAPHPEADDGLLRAATGEAARRVEAAMERFDLPEALAAIWDLIHRANKYIDEQAPWALNREGRRERLEAVLYAVAETARVVGVLLSPFLVETPARLWAQIGLGEDYRVPGWEEGLKWGQLPAGARVRRDRPLFPRIEWEEATTGENGGRQGASGKEGPGKEEGAAKEGAAPRRAAPVPAGRAAGAKPASGGEITIEEFGRIELRTARVVAAERHPNADRLLRLEVSLGSERRQIVAGIAGHYEPEELVDKMVVIVANLRPAVIRGVESQGMVLTAEEDGRLALLTTDRPIGEGSHVR